MSRALCSLLFVGALGAGLGAGCYGPSTVGYSYGYVSAPALAHIGPGVQVVTNFNYPVFYANGLYWRYYRGYWYRSPALYGSWVFAPRVPAPVLAIRRPWAYVHYRHGRYYRDHRYYYYPYRG